MNFEEIKKNYQELLNKIGMEALYNSSVKDAEIAIKIVENENLYNENVKTLVFLYSLVNKIDMEILIDKRQLQKLVGSSIYDNSIRSMIFYFDKPDYKEFLNEDEQTVIGIYKDIEIINKLEKLNSNIQIANTDTINEQIINVITTNKQADESQATNTLEKAVVILSNVFSIKYKYTVYIVEENNYIDNIIKQLNTIEANKTVINKIYASIKKYAMERL